jgi:hypothetical protein
MPRPIVIQARDLDILHSLSVGRYLTVEALEWLHVPGWRQRWRAFQQQGAHDPERRYYPTVSVYRRMAGLRAGGFVQTITRTAERGATTFVRMPDVYALTDAGADLLSSRRHLPIEAIWVERSRTRSLQNFEHSVAIGRCYAALRTAAEQLYPAEMQDWRGDHVLARGYDRVAVAGASELLPVLPDASFRLSGQQYFVEIDRSTRPLASWREKIQALEAYVGSSALRARYGVGDATLLVVAPSANRLRRIAEEVVTVLQAASTRYLFVLAEYLHPTRVRANWQRVAAVAWAPRQRFDRIVVQPQLTFDTVALWGAPPRAQG